MNPRARPAPPGFIAPGGYHRPSEFFESESRNALSLLPADPVPPRVFFEDTVPAIFADFEFDEVERALDLRLGVVLLPESETQEGGAWTLHFVEGELGIAEGRSEDCDLTVIQTVADWRSVLWEGRPAWVAEMVTRVAESGPEALRSEMGFLSLRNPAALKGLSEIRGLVEILVEADRSDATNGVERVGAHGDWRLGLLVGPGPIPPTPQASIRLGAEQAEAIRRGALHPLEALITGQLRLEGDLGLILQLQAVAMTATMPPSPIDRAR